MDGEATQLDKFQTPFNKDIEIFDVALDNNVNLLRVRIREGKRFTIMDLDPVTAQRWAEIMENWASAHMTKE